MIEMVGRIRGATLIVVVGIAALATGCGAGAASSGGTSPGASSSAAAAGPPASTAAPSASAGPKIAIATRLQGTWTSDVQNTTATSGLWTLKIDAANAYLKNPQAGADFFSIDPTSFDAGAMVLPAAADCPDQATVTEGRYTYVLAGDVLTFTLVADSCGDRSGTLVAGPWARQ